MVSINLLPWRAARADYRVASLKKKLGVILVLAWMGLVVAHVIFTHLNQALSRELKHLQVLIQTHPAPRVSHHHRHWHETVHQWRAHQQQWSAWLTLLRYWKAQGLCLQSLHIGQQRRAITGLSTSIDALQILMTAWRAEHLDIANQWSLVRATSQSRLMQFEVGGYRHAMLAHEPQEKLYDR